MHSAQTCNSHRVSSTSSRHAPSTAPKRHSAFVTSISTSRSHRSAEPGQLRGALALLADVDLRARGGVDLRCCPADLEFCSISRLACSRMQSRPYSKLLS